MKNIKKTERLVHPMTLPINPESAYAIAKGLPNHKKRYLSDFNGRFKPSKMLG